MTWDDFTLDDWLTFSEGNWLGFAGKSTCIMTTVYMLESLSGDKGYNQGQVYSVEDALATEWIAKGNARAWPPSGNLAAFTDTAELEDTGVQASDLATNAAVAAAIATKADKVASPTNGNLAGLDTNGNLTDSGVAASAVGGPVSTMPDGATIAVGADNPTPDGSGGNAGTANIATGGSGGPFSFDGSSGGSGGTVNIAIGGASSTVPGLDGTVNLPGGVSVDSTGLHGFTVTSLPDGAKIANGTDISTPDTNGGNAGTAYIGVGGASGPQSDVGATGGHGGTVYIAIGGAGSVQQGADGTVNLPGGVQITPAGINIKSYPLTPVGAICLSVAPYAPWGWLLCDGTTPVHYSDYPNLYGLLGGTLDDGGAEVAPVVTPTPTPPEGFSYIIKHD